MGHGWLQIGPSAADFPPPRFAAFYVLNTASGWIRWRLADFFGLQDGSALACHGCSYFTDVIVNSSDEQNIVDLIVSQVPQRRRVFPGCEGESEASCGALLALLVKERSKLIYIDNHPLRPGAGGPLALVDKAIGIMQRRAKERGKYAAKFLLLDTDKCSESPERDADAHKHATEQGLVLIWQEPCHEAFLLRHLEGCEFLQPQTCPQAKMDLKRGWPE